MSRSQTIPNSKGPTGQNKMTPIAFVLLRQYSFAYISGIFNPIALRKAKTGYNFGLSECSRVK